MPHLPFVPKKKNTESADEPKQQSFWFRNLLPLCVGAVCVLLVIGNMLKAAFYRPETVTVPQSFDCCATVAAVGDISLSAKQLRSFHTTADSYDFGNVFRQVAQSVSAADLALGNLEGVVTNDSGKVTSNSFPPSFLTALSDCGFDLLQTANSFSIQNGISSIEMTKTALEEKHMIAAGTFRSAEEKSSTGGISIIEINGIRIAVAAFTKGLNNMHLPEGSEYAVNLLYRDYDTEYTSINEEGITTCMSNAKAAGADFIIAMVHWGSENGREISDSQKQIADLLIKNGADVILGSHSHIVSQIERRTVQRPEGGWKDVYIAYSLGDFLTASEQSRSQYGCILNLRLEKDSRTGACAVTDIRYTPTYCTSPSKSLGTEQYAVIDSLNAIRLREEHYVDAISEALSEKLTQTLEALAEQTGTDYQVEK